MTDPQKNLQPLTLDTHISKGHDVFGASVDGELVLFHPESGSYYGSGPVGERIWEILAEVEHVQAIVCQIVGEFEVDRATCERDVLSFLEELRSRELIHVTAL